MQAGIETTIEQARKLLRVDPSRSLDISATLMDQGHLESADQINLYLVISRAHINKGTYAEGEPYARDAVLIAREHGHQRLEGLALNEYGIYHFVRGELAQALQLYGQAIPLLERFATTAEVAKVHVNIGNVYHRRGEYSNASEAYEAVLRSLSDGIEPELEAKVLTNLASLYQYSLHDPDTALEYTNRAIQVFRNLGDTVGLGKALHNYGQFLRGYNRNEEAIAAYREALDIRKDFAEPSDLALNYSGLVGAYLEMGDFVLAEAMLAEADRVLPSRGVSEDAFNFVEMARADYYTMTNRVDLAIELFGRLSEWAQREDLHDFLQSMLSVQAKLQFEQGRYQQAAESWRHQLSLRDKQERQRAETRLLHLKHQIEATRGESRAQVERLRNVELAEAVRRLELMYRENEEYMAFLAHELKNPLNTIRTVAGMLGSDNRMETDERMEFDREIHSIATRMLDLVNKSLSSSRARLVSVVSNVDAVIPFRHILHTQASVAREKGVLFDGVVHQEPLIVQADDQDLVTIFENLIGNAVKFTPKNGHVQAAIRATGNPTEPPRMLFSVSDSGPGLTLADQVKLFQPFSRLSARPTGTEVSTGLGLHLVKRTVEQLQGRVWCESEPGHGATFFVELPLAQEGG